MNHEDFNRVLHVIGNTILRERPDAWDNRFHVASEIVTAIEAAGFDITPTTPTNVINERVALWLATLIERASQHYTYTAEPLHKYVRIVASHSGGSRSVHAFYDPATGDVFKSSSWKAPAKLVRFNLLDDASFTRMIEICDPHGSYLYIR